LKAIWDGISLAYRKTAILNDNPSWVWSKTTEIEKRLLAETCELCGATEDIQVHHIKALKNLQKPGRREPAPWKEIMVTRRRKTLVVCRKCHNDIHWGRLQRTPDSATLESRMT